MWVHHLFTLVWTLDHSSSGLHRFVSLRARRLFLIVGAVNHLCARSPVIKLATASQRPVWFATVDFRPAVCGYAATTLVKTKPGDCNDSERRVVGPSIQQCATDETNFIYISSISLQMWRSETHHQSTKLAFQFSAGRLIIWFFCYCVDPGRQRG